MCIVVKADETKMKPYLVISRKKVKEELKSIPGDIITVSTHRIACMLQ